MSTYESKPMDVRKYDTLRFSMDMEVSNDGETWALVKAGVDAPSCRWARTPITPRTPSLEDRRRGLKPGDRITEPELLAKGMRVKWVGYEGVLGEPEAYGDNTKWRLGEAWSFIYSDLVTAKDPANFLGWATEEKGESLGTISGQSIIGRAANTTGQWVGIEPLQTRFLGPGDVEQMYAQQGYQPAAKPIKTTYASPMAFTTTVYDTQKRHPDCKASHEPRTGCAPCERLIAAEMLDLEAKTAPASKPATKLPYEPRCGDFVGRVMTPVVRR